MAENTDEEQLDNSPNTQSKNLSDKIIPTISTGTIPQNQESENMEVHKHSHHVMHKKKWGEYLLEFFMLFLAVFLGFIAENIREHYVEKERAKQYAQSLYDDFKVDTATIQRTYSEKEWIKGKFDSAQLILASSELNKKTEFIYYVERYVIFNDIFSPQDVTYQQLRSSGNFRYIENISLYKSIADYYNLYSRYQSVDGEFGYVNQNELSEIESKIFNVKDLTSLDNNNATNFYNLALPAERKLEPLINDKHSQDLLYIKIDNAKLRATGSILLLGRLKSAAINLLRELKEEYHLK